jgi:methenyltetrahydromethanopterin cyclohydrolase
MTTQLSSDVVKLGAAAILFDFGIELSGHTIATLLLSTFEDGGTSHGSTTGCSGGFLAEDSPVTTQLSSDVKRLGTTATLLDFGIQLNDSPAATLLLTTLEDDGFGGGSTTGCSESVLWKDSPMTTQLS